MCAEAEAEPVAVEPTTEETGPEPTTEEADAELKLTMGQQDAIQPARSYPDFMAFSRTGLIDQLVFEEYSTEDATFTVDSLEVDWNEQAAAKAEEYLDFTGSS